MLGDGHGRFAAGGGNWFEESCAEGRHGDMFSRTTSTTAKFCARFCVFTESSSHREYFAGKIWLEDVLAADFGEIGRANISASRFGVHCSNAEYAVQIAALVLCTRVRSCASGESASVCGSHILGCIECGCAAEMGFYIRG